MATHAKLDHMERWVDQTATRLCGVTSLATHLCIDQWLTPTSRPQSIQAMVATKTKPARTCTEPVSTVHCDHLSIPMTLHPAMHGPQTWRVPMTTKTQHIKAKLQLSVFQPAPPLIAGRYESYLLIGLMMGNAVPFDVLWSALPAAGRFYSSSPVYRTELKPSHLFMCSFFKYR